MPWEDGPVSSPLQIPGWRHIYSGKVRDLYASEDPGDTRILVVASDRVSAFDFVLSPGIPEKGELLTTLSMWWFEKLGDVPNHIAEGEIPDAVAGRAMLAMALDMQPIECVVRGYLTGSGWAEYVERGTVCGIALTPDGPRFVVIANDDGGIVPALIEYVEPDEEEAVLH